jgi:hypothetical protein
MVKETKCDIVLLNSLYDHVHELSQFLLADLSIIRHETSCFAKHLHKQEIGSWYVRR